MKKKEIFGLISPHADYPYSGRVAARGYKEISGKKFDTVIILADSHYERFGGVSVWPDGFWQTSLGKIMIDKNLAQKIISASPRFFRRDSAHLFEHSIEILLPGLQKTLKKFKILPIIFGSENKDWPLLAETIFKNLKRKKVLIVASSDLSHNLPHQKAIIRDKKTIKSILDLNTKNLDVCAPDSVKTILTVAKKLEGKAKLLEYRFKKTGYAAIAFYKVHNPRDYAEHGAVA